jgi:hypothetical protein
MTRDADNTHGVVPAQAGTHNHQPFGEDVARAS